MKEPKNNILTVYNNDGLKLNIELNRDADLEERHKAFLTILNWITFINPEKDLLLKDSEYFYEVIEEMNK